MTKSELELGMYTKFRDGRLGLLLGDPAKTRDNWFIALGEGSYSEMRFYTEELCNTNSRHRDIVEVGWCDCSGAFESLMEKDHPRREMWIREEVDWSEVPEHTPVWVKDSSSDVWTPRYFLSYKPGTSYPFKITDRGKHSYDPTCHCTSNYKHCTLTKPEDIM